MTLKISGKWLRPALVVFAAVILLVIVIVTRSPDISPAPDEPAATDPFYGVGAKLEERLERIALADSGIQTLIEGRDYSFTADGHIIEDKDYNLSVGVRLKDDINKEDFQEWMNGGRQDSNIIEEYVGILNIGYNEKYYITFDMDKEIISHLESAGGSIANIPEVTAEEEQRAVEIALADVTLQQILEGKEYQLAPDGKIGVWHSGDIKLGVSFEISFDRVYIIDAELPNYQRDSQRVTGGVEGLLISVLLEESRVASIAPISPIES
jgi:hypothetical protein